MNPVELKMRPAEKAVCFGGCVEPHAGRNLCCSDYADAANGPRGGSCEV